MQTLRSGTQCSQYLPFYAKVYMTQTLVLCVRELRFRELQTLRSRTRSLRTVRSRELCEYSVREL